MEKVLIAVDGDVGSMNAVNYAGRNFVGMNDLQVTLFHVLPAASSGLWQKGHTVSVNGNTQRKIYSDHYEDAEKRRAEPIFAAATDILVRRGFTIERIDTKSVFPRGDVAESILTEVKRGAYGTVVLGRYGPPGIARLSPDGIVSKVISQGNGIAICVVE